MHLVHGVGELLGELEVGRAGFAPHQVGVVGVGHGAADGLVHALFRLVEAFGGALAGDERLVVLVVVAGQQVGRFGVGAGDHERGHAADVGSHAGRDQLLQASAVGTSTLPPMWPHFLTDASWSSKCTPAAPALIMAFISSKAFSTPPKPASASATMGAK
jgi:hypothetical protein